MGDVKKLADARDLDWPAAKLAAQRIIRICEDAGFTAPEALDVLQGKIALVCVELNGIAAALLITPGSGILRRPSGPPNDDAPLATAFDSAARAITGQSAAALNAKLDSELIDDPDNRFDSSDAETVLPTTSMGDWDMAGDQVTSPAPLQTMAEVQADGGEAPHVESKDGAR